MAGKALIAMSGGVDSSVAAMLVKNMGYDCIGCTMRLFDKEKDTPSSVVLPVSLIRRGSTSWESN